MPTTYDIGIVVTYDVAVYPSEPKRIDVIGKAELLKLGTYTNEPRECYWRSKDMDFVEQLGGEAMDSLKQINYVKLFYVDLDSSVPTNIHISVDGGNTWAVRTALIGSGDSLAKTYVFDFDPTERITGTSFTFMISCLDASKEFKWTGLEIDLTLLGSRIESDD